MSVRGEVYSWQCQHLKASKNEPVVGEKELRFLLEH